MSNETDYYAAVLADLERRRDELDRLIAGIRHVMGLGGSSPEGAPGGGGGTVHRGEPARELRSDAFFNMKAPEAVRSYLAIMKRPQSIPEIVEGLRAGGFITGAKDLYNNLYTAILRMKASGTVVKVHGKWGLAEWYPVRSKAKAKAEGAEKETDKGASDADDVDLTEFEQGKDKTTAA
jgi:hypothetical protein